MDKEKYLEGYLGYETRYNDLKDISNEVGAFNTEHAGLLKTRFKSVVDAVTKMIKPMIPQWREYVIKTEDKEEIIANLLQTQLNNTIGDVYTLGRAVQGEVEMLIVNVDFIPHVLYNLFLNHLSFHLWRSPIRQTVWACFLT